MSVLSLDRKLFEKLVNEEKKTVLLDFWAPWCVYCRRIAPALDKIAEQFEGEVVVAKVNVDEQPEIAEEEGIEVLPTLVLYRDGSAIESVVAPQSKAAIEEFIRGALA